VIRLGTFGREEGIPFGREIKSIYLGERGDKDGIQRVAPTSWVSRDLPELKQPGRGGKGEGRASGRKKTAIQKQNVGRGVGF